MCAPALFDRAERGVELGYTPEDIAKGRDYRMKLTDAQVMADVEAAAAHLAGKKLGIVGYCFGGTVAWWGATRSTQLRRVVLLVRRRHRRHQGRDGRTARCRCISARRTPRSR